MSGTRSNKSFRLGKLNCPPHSHRNPAGPLKMATTRQSESQQLTDAQGSHRGKEKDEREAKGRPHGLGLSLSVERILKPNLF